MSVPGAVVADGHVVLAPARDALGATQGTRVTLTLTSIAGPSSGDANGGTAVLGPVIREGGDGSEPERGTESKLGDLTAAHLAALRLPRDHVNVDEDAVADAARDLLARRWSATVARFSMTFRNARLDDGARTADPNDANDFGAPPPVATGSVVQLEVGDDSLIATFELEVHAPGGACELTSGCSSGATTTERANHRRRRRRESSSAGASGGPRTTLPPCPLFGTSVTVDATLRDALGTVAPVGSASREVATMRRRDWRRR